MWTSTTGGYSSPYTWIDSYRDIDGAIIPRRFVPDTLSSTINIPSLSANDMSELDWYRLNGIDIQSEEEIPKMKIYENKEVASIGQRYAVACSHEPDLSQDKILKCISIMKSKLMMQCAPRKVADIECKMTPVIKHNIISAWKRLDRYGKKPPFVARFDEYGRRLPDEIKIDTMKGMTIKIVDPTEYGSHYISFEGVVYDETLYQPTFDWKYDTETPF